MPVSNSSGTIDLEKDNLLELARRSIDPEVLELIKQVDAALVEEAEREPDFVTTTIGACHAGEGAPNQPSISSQARAEGD